MFCCIGNVRVYTAVVLWSTEQNYTDRHVCRSTITLYVSCVAGQNRIIQIGMYVDLLLHCMSHVLQDRIELYR